MKVQLNPGLISHDMKPLLHPTTGDQVVLKDVLYQALFAPLDGDVTMTIEQKVTIWKLAQTIFLSGDDADLPLESLVILKDRVGRYHPASIVGPVCEVLGWMQPVPSDLLANMASLKEEPPPSEM